MATFGSVGYSGPKETKYLFIDGGCLRQILKDFSENWLDGRDVIPNFEAIKSTYSKVFYYDAIYVKRIDESDDDYQSRIEPMVTQLQSIRMLDGYHVYEGDVRRRGKRGPEQKKVDVMIAVDMLTHSFRRNMHQASLLSNDLDFKPLLDALVLEGMHVELIYQEGWANDDLISAADKKSPLRLNTLFYWIQNKTNDERNQFLPTQLANLLIADDALIWKKIDNKGKTWELGKHGKFYDLQCLNSYLNHRFRFDNMEKLLKFVLAQENITFLD